MPEGLSAAEKRREAIRKAMAELEAGTRQKAGKEQVKKKEKAKRQGKKHNPRKKVLKITLKDKAQCNFTDMESRIMPNSDKMFIQGYNGQIAVGADTQIIVAADISNQAADIVHLPDIVHQVIIWHP